MEMKKWKYGNGRSFSATVNKPPNPAMERRKQPNWDEKGNCGGAGLHAIHVWQEWTPRKRVQIPQDREQGEQGGSPKTHQVKSNHAHGLLACLFSSDEKEEVESRRVRMIPVEDVWSQSCQAEGVATGVIGPWCFWLTCILAIS